LGRIFGDANFQEITESSLQSDFTEYYDKQFIMGSEITGSDKSRVSADILKQLITGDKLRVNRKYMQAYYIDNRINFYFTSNRSTAFFLEDNDRRMFIHEMKDHKLTAKFFRDYVNNWMLLSGPAALFYYYKYEYELAEHFDPYGRAYVTEAKKIMIEENRSTLGMWVDQLLFDPASILGKLDKRDMFKSSELMELFNLAHDDKQTKVSASGMSRALRPHFKLMFNGEVLGPPQSTPFTPGRYFCVRNQAYWLEPSHNTRDEINDHFRKAGKKSMLKGGSKVVAGKF